MLENLKKLNPDFHVFSVYDPEFKPFGRILDLNAEEIIRVGETFEMPEGVIYKPSIDAFEELDIAAEIRDEVYGTLPTQIGYCYGHSRMLNATEWHTASEVNIAVTDFVLLLGHLWDIENGKIDSSQFKAFYVPKGTSVEVYATSLHYCPCQVSDEGFKCVVGLPSGTNTALDKQLKDKKITAKNKWLIAHVDNEAKIKQGAVPGITGINFEVKYSSML